MLFFLWYVYMIGYFDIFMYDLANPSAGAQPVFVGSGNQWDPAINGSIISWADSDDIYIYDLSNPSAGAELVYNGPGFSNMVYSPDISGNIIVWQEGEGIFTYDIYMYNLANHAAGAQPVYVHEGLQSGPVISGNIVVWEEGSSDDVDIWMADIRTLDIHKEGTGSNFLGDTINLYGTNTYSSDTYLILTGSGLDQNGVTLTDLSAKASDGHFSTAATNAAGTWTYTWDTNAVIGGSLVPSTYTIYAMDTPADLSNMDNHYTMLSITFKQPFYPVANAGPPKSIIINENIPFDGSGSTDSDGTIVSYAWDFGYSTRGSGETTSHIYTAAGTYTVTLTVTDNDGLIGSDTVEITVKTPAETLKDLITNVDDLGLPKGIEQGLLAKLDTAQKKIAQEQYTPARNALNAFMNDVNGQRGKSLTPAQADELVATTQQIINSIPRKYYLFFLIGTMKSKKI